MRRILGKISHSTKREDGLRKRNSYERVKVIRFTERRRTPNKKKKNSTKDEIGRQRKSVGRRVAITERETRRVRSKGSRKKSDCKKS